MERAIDELRAGGLLAYPTETLFGLGVDARSAAAVERLLRWKGREAGRPLPVLVEDGAALERLGVAVSRLTRRLFDAFWPGPLTVVLACPAIFAPGVAREDGAVGFRCSSHPLTAALARGAARGGVGPLTATSLNRSGEPPACSVDEAARYCDGRPGSPVLLEGGDSGSTTGTPSSVLDMTGSRPRMLREGAISTAAVHAVLEENRRS